MPEYADAYFESCEFPPVGDPVGIRITLEGEGLPSMGLGTSQLHLMGRPGVDLFKLDALAAEMRALLKGVQIVHHR